MNRTSNRMTILGIGLFSGWGGLGAYRGVQDYNKKYNSENIRYLERPTYCKKPQYYYLSCFGSAMGCFAFYIMPVFLPITVTMELYSLEEKIRGIEDKK